MIDLYTAQTPNGWKASTMLEELEMPYNACALKLQENEQKELRRARPAVDRGLHVPGNEDAESGRKWLEKFRAEGH